MRMIEPGDPIVTIKLDNVEKSVKINDMDYEFVYQRLFSPDEEPTSYFSLCYKEKSQEVWSTCNGLLSKNFTIVRTEDAIKDIQNKLGAKLLAEKHFQSGPSIKSLFILKDYQLKIDTDSKADKFLFNLLTNVNADSVQSRTGLAFSVINGYAGNLALQLNYGFLTNLLESSPSDPNNPAKINVNNVFILDNFSHRLIHDGSMSVSYEKVSNVRQACFDRVQLFKSIPITAQFLEEFQRRFPNKFAKLSIEIISKLPDNFQNMYYATFIWSSLLDQVRRINTELSLRRFVTKHVNLIIKEREREAAKQKSLTEGQI